MTKPDQWQPTFEGLTLPAGQITPLEAAARATLAALDDDGLLEPRHALTAQLILDLSASIGAGVRTGKTAAVALAAKQLLDAIASLPEPAEQTDGAFDELLRRLSEADEVKP